jgi:DNA polymerase III epsilon subunit family exonuclease
VVIPDATAVSLFDTTFVILDFETTGTSPEGAAITEVGAVRSRGGECLGTFQTLVNPGLAIPPSIVYLTGITEAMVAPAPTIESVLPALAEFIGDAVIVGHNVRFDLAFLRANLARLGYPPPSNLSVDTLALARRLLAGDVADCRLQTVARHLHTVADPSHRALEDARATSEVFHRFLEDVGSLGITHLDDLLALPTLARHPQFAKVRWAGRLPRTPGTYLFRDVAGRVLHVGSASDLRRAVRQHFADPDRRRIGPLLREAQSLEHHPCETELEAVVRELRLVHTHLPRFHPATRQLVQQRDLRILRRRSGWHVGVCSRTRPRAAGEQRVGPFGDAASARAAASMLSTRLAAGVDIDLDDALQASVPQALQDRRARIDNLVGAGRLTVVVEGRPLEIDAGVLSLTDASPPPTVEAAEDEADLLAAWWSAPAAPAARVDLLDGVVA